MHRRCGGTGATIIKSGLCLCLGPKVLVILPPPPRFLFPFFCLAPADCLTSIAFTTIFFHFNLNANSLAHFFFVLVVGGQRREACAAVG